LIFVSHCHSDETRTIKIFQHWRSSTGYQKYCFFTSLLNKLGVKKIAKWTSAMA
jgi:hypothetical protein